MMESWLAFDVTGLNPTKNSKLLKNFEILFLHSRHFLIVYKEEKRLDYSMLIDNQILYT